VKIEEPIEKEVERWRLTIWEAESESKELRQLLSKAEATIASLRETIRVIEHDKGSLHNRCCWCNEVYPDHRDDCMRQKALAEAPK